MKKAFTLIELLIVIALLGALAVGLLAALDPFEQLKKGTDTGVRNTVQEVHGSIIRYYAIKSEMPWCVTEAGVTTCELDSFTEGEPGEATPNFLSTLGTNVIKNITDTGELKTDFEDLAGPATLAKISVFGSNDPPFVQVCYLPTSKSFTNDPNTKWDPDTGADTCVNTKDPANNTCLWCVK